MHNILVYTRVKLFLKFCFTACIIREKEKVNLCQRRIKKRGKSNTYPLLNSTTITAWFKTKKKINPHQHRSKKRVNQENEILTSCSIAFAQYLTHDSIRKKKVWSIRVSTTARNESIRLTKYLQAAPFHSRNIHRMIQKQKEEDPPKSASQQETSQLGKANTYPLVHSIPVIFTAWFKNKRKKINSRQHRSKKRVN